MIPGQIEPQRLQQIMAEVVQQQTDNYNNSLKETLESGWLIWSMAPPKQRLKGYMASTLREDIPLVLTDGYLDLWRNGILPELQANVLFRTAALASQQTGQPIMDTAELFWPLLMTLPNWVFEKFQHDFANLAKALLKEVSGGMSGLPIGSGPVPALPPGQENPAMESAPANMAALP